METLARFGFFPGLELNAVYNQVASLKEHNIQ